MCKPWLIYLWNKGTFGFSSITLLLYLAEVVIKAFRLIKCNLGELNIGFMSHLVVHSGAPNTLAKGTGLVNLFAIHRTSLHSLFPPDCYVLKAALRD